MHIEATVSYARAVAEANWPEFEMDDVSEPRNVPTFHHNDRRFTEEPRPRVVG
jgi:hypothetical protein